MVALFGLLIFRHLITLYSLQGYLVSSDRRRSPMNWKRLGMKKPWPLLYQNWAGGSEESHGIIKVECLSERRHLNILCMY
jgi:hypothetical protein